MNNDIQAWKIFDTLNGIDQTEWHGYLIDEKNAEYSARKYYKIPDCDTIIIAEEATGDPFFQYIKKSKEYKNESREWETVQYLETILPNEWHNYLTNVKGAEYSSKKFYKISAHETIVLAENSKGDTLKSTLLSSTKSG